MAILVSGVGIGVRSEKRLHRLRVPRDGGNMEWRIANLVSGVRGGAGSKQRFHRLRAPMPSRKVQGRLAQVVACRHVSASG